MRSRPPSLSHLAARLPEVLTAPLPEGSANRRCATSSRLPPAACSLREDALSVCTTMKPIQTSARTWTKLHQLKEIVCASERVRGDVRCARSGDVALGAIAAACTHSLARGCCGVCARLALLKYECWLLVDNSPLERRGSRRLLEVARAFCRGVEHRGRKSKH